MTTDDFKSRDATSYDPVAAEYDGFIERFSSAMAAHPLALARVTSGTDVLDVGTGTGIVALKAAALMNTSRKVMAVDLSEGMLTIARGKALDRNLADRVEFRAMDAEQLEFPDASFDVVVSMFALHHFPNPERALSEMYRVLRPGGIVSIGVGSGPSRATWIGIVDAGRQVRDLVLRYAGRLLRAPQFIDELVNTHFPDNRPDELTDLAARGWKAPGTVPAMVRRTGFEAIATDWIGAREVIRTPDEFWELQRVYSSTARKRLATVTRDQVDTLRRAFLDRCHSVQQRGGELVYSHAALYITARKPQRT